LILIIITKMFELINEMNMKQYLRYVSYKHYPEIDNSIIDSFIRIMISKDNYPIISDDLILWNILRFNRLLIKYNFVENKDYILLYDQGNITYALSVISFKKCLIYSKKNIYKEYFIFLETYLHYYQNCKLSEANQLIKEYEEEDIDNIIGWIILAVLFLFIELLLYSYIEDRLILSFQRIIDKKSSNYNIEFNIISKLIISIINIIKSIFII